MTPVVIHAVALTTEVFFLYLFVYVGGLEGGGGFPGGPGF